MLTKIILFLIISLILFPGFGNYALSQNTRCFPYITSSAMLKSKSEQILATAIIGQTIVGRTQTNNDVGSLGFLFFTKKTTTGNRDDKKPESDLEIKLYPNPCENFIDILIDNPKTVSYSIIVTNYQGQNVLKNNFLNNSPSDLKIRLNISKYQRGIYFVIILADNQKMVKSFIKF